MKFIHSFVCFVLIVMTAIVFVNSQTPRQTTRQTPPGKPSKMLVKKLPLELKGIELRDGRLALKSGYKFVKESNNTITVALDNGSPTGTSLTCSCQVPGNERVSGACIPIVDYDPEGWEFFYCEPLAWSPCSGWCVGVGGYTGKQRVPLATFRSARSS